MRIKNNKVNIKNLHPCLANKHEALTALWRRHGAKDYVIISGNDGKHSKNSLHYKDRAEDPRVFNLPDMTIQKLGRFLRELEETLPDTLYDVLIKWNPLRFHIEFDPKPSPAKIALRLQSKLEPEPLKKQVPVEEIKPRIKIHKRSGFKRKAGAVLGVLGGIFCFIPHPAIQAIGVGIVMLGGATEVIGIGDGMMKNRLTTKDTKIDKVAILRWIADLLIKLFNKKGK